MVKANSPFGTGVWMRPPNSGVFSRVGTDSQPFGLPVRLNIQVVQYLHMVSDKTRRCDHQVLYTLLGQPRQHFVELGT